MARTTGRSGFKLRSGNKPSMSRLAGISPAKFKLKYPVEEYTKRGFDPNRYSVKEKGKVIKDGNQVMNFRHDPNDPASVNVGREAYDKFLFKLSEIEGKIAKSMEKAKARDQEVDDSEGDRQNF